MICLLVTTKNNMKDMYSVSTGKNQRYAHTKTRNQETNLLKLLIPLPFHHSYQMEHLENVHPAEGAHTGPGMLVGHNLLKSSSTTQRTENRPGPFRAKHFFFFSSKKKSQKMSDVSD